MVKVVVRSHGQHFSVEGHRAPEGRVVACLGGREPGLEHPPRLEESEEVDDPRSSIALVSPDGLQSRDERCGSAAFV